MANPEFLSGTNTSQTTWENTLSPREMLEQLDQRIPALSDPTVLMRDAEASAEEKAALGYFVLRGWLDKLGIPPSVQVEANKQLPPEGLTRSEWQLYKAGEGSVGQTMLRYERAAREDPSLARPDSLHSLADEIHDYREQVQRSAYRTDPETGKAIPVTGEVVYIAALPMTEVFPKSLENNRKLRELYQGERNIAETAA